MTAPQPASLRRERERELVQATRALFDERGAQDAPIEEIARAVGIARGLIYRQFSSKEELYVLTVTEYLTELDGLLADATSADLRPVAQLEAWARAYVGFCLRYPAFLDCALSLMHRPARELHDALSDSVWLRLGQGIAGCVAHVSEILRSGAADGSFAVDDPDYMANVLWTQVLGATHLARIRVGVRQAAPGIPELFAVTPERLVETCVASVLATVGARTAEVHPDRRTRAGGGAA
jgi:AcrR family transcriptional regulator